MPSQVLTSVENNFTKGLITESTGLNFPENAATSADNCVFNLIGNTNRRLGIDYEVNFQTRPIDRSGRAISPVYKWNNVGGDGLTQVVVFQVGHNLYFYPSSLATITAPLSTLSGASNSLSLDSFVTSPSLDSTIECQFSDGNGYLFVYHPNCNPFFVTYSNGVVTANLITVKIRDFTGIPEPGVDVTVRPLTLSNEHAYNLNNQGWVKHPAWTVPSSTSIVLNIAPAVFTVASGLTIAPGDRVAGLSNADVSPGGIFQPAGTNVFGGNVTSYVGTSLTISITSVNPIWAGVTYDGWSLNSNSDYTSIWNSAIGNFPSNADVWWYFKDSTNTFNPATQINNVTFGVGSAPKGHFILDAFSQRRSNLTGISNLTDVSTTVRPRTGTWFQGRVWFTGVDASFQPSGDAPYYTWTENIYFSQISVDSTGFGKCYQNNDPTSENLFDLLPTDGGVITIQGSGSIYRLFPIQNGMLVFASNGVWFITGSTGIGFSASDYTITKISSVRSISSTSFVDVQGLPYFWNEEGIYAVKPTQGGGLSVEPITVGTILSLYNAIPFSSKQTARGAYDPINYVIQWIYRDTESASVVQRYQFNKILNFNTFNNAFYPFTVANTGSDGNVWINGIVYVVGPGGSTSPLPSIKYLTSVIDSVNATYQITFADEHDATFTDWVSSNGVGLDFESNFTVGYKLHGQAIKRFQVPYVHIYSKMSFNPNGYKIQGLWDFSNNRNSGKWSVAQIVSNFNSNLDYVQRRHRIRGRGLALQIKITSVTKQSFDIIGWSIYENVNAGV